jgi:hypothetical protein
MEIIVVAIVIIALSVGFEFGLGNFAGEMSFDLRAAL